MTFKIFNLLAVLLLISTAANAQKNNKGATKEKTKEVPLQKFPDKGFPENTFPIADITLIQVVPDSTRLGYLQKGLGETKVTAIPDMPLTSYFQSYINKKYESSYNKDGVHFLWVLKNVRINQRPFEFGDKAYLYFNADVYISKDGNSYNFVTAVDTLLIEGDVNYDINMHYRNIRNALQLLLQTTIDKGRNFTDTANSFLVTQLISKEQQRFNLPIYTDTLYKEGAYANFKEFLNNSPSIIDFKTVVANKNKTVIIVSGKDSIQPWGICQKGELYKYHQSNLIAIEKQANGFIMSGYVSGINRRNRNVLTAGVAGAYTDIIGGDILGRALARAASEKLITVTSLPYIKKHQPEACTVNMVTGEWFF